MRRFTPLFVLALIFVAGWTSLAFAQAFSLPGSADVGRVHEDAKPVLPHSGNKDIIIKSETSAGAPAPAGAEEMRFVLNTLSVEGATVYTKDSLKDIYAGDLGHEISLARLWDIAGAITKRYRDDGYFLSRAYVPEQSIKDGNAVIRVVEGYIGKIEMDPAIAQAFPVRALIDRLLTKHPVRAADVESFLLRLDDLAGLSFRAILAPWEGHDSEEGGIVLNLQTREEESTVLVSVDNYGSRYLGPQQAAISYSTSLVPMHQTTFGASVSLPKDEMNQLSLDHTLAIGPGVTLGANWSLTRAHPGHTLEQFNIDSSSISMGMTLLWQPVRQRQKNISFSATLEGKNVSSDILGAPLTRDHIRALRLRGYFDGADPWEGYNVANLTLSRGLDIFSATEAGYLYASRAQAAPDFTKMELSWMRQQSVLTDWLLYTAAAGQYAPDPVYSSEEFGYGGQSFGRAYDASEITGEKGVSGSLELRYQGIAPGAHLNFVPFAFYDLGKVWQNGADQSGSSAGLGSRFSSSFNMSGEFGLAFPLTRDISTPLYGKSSSSPRLFVKINYTF